MAKQMKKRIPVIVLVCEGRNKTERKYFNHFVTRDALYKLIISDCEATDVESMAKKTIQLYKHYELSKKNNDHAFCLIDLDMKSEKYNKLLELKTKYKNIEFIVSNPCFEVWFLYHMEKYPKKFSSSQKVKEYMSKYITNYEESMDVYSILQLEDKFLIAINNSVLKNEMYNEELSIIDRNPYTTIQDVVDLLIKLNG